MNKNTFQEKNWANNFGNKYILRSPYSVKEADKFCKDIYGKGIDELYKDFFNGFDKSIKILEVGSNVGTKLMYLQKKGFKNLYGLEINPKAVETAKSLTKGINFIQGSAFDIPFKDGYFDLVFTAGVLIHISPLDIKKAMSEIYRCSKKYIFGLEYFAPKYTEIIYRGKKNMLWKTDFPKLYTDIFKDLKIIKRREEKHLNSKNIDILFLLRKKHGKN